MLAISYFNRIDIYQLKSEQLVFVNSLVGFTNGIISPDAKRILTTKVKSNQPISQIIEFELPSLIPTGLHLKQVSIAMYHQSDVVYLNSSNQLVQISGDEHLILTSHINTPSLAKIAISNNKLYYVSAKTGQLYEYDLRVNTSNVIELHNLVPTRITIVNGELYIRTKKSLLPRIMIGTITEY